MIELNSVFGKWVKADQTVTGAAKYPLSGITRKYAAGEVIGQVDSFINRNGETYLSIKVDEELIYINAEAPVSLSIDKPEDDSNFLSRGMVWIDEKTDGLSYSVAKNAGFVQEGLKGGLLSLKDIQNYLKYGIYLLVGLLIANIINKIK